MEWIDYELSVDVEYAQEISDEYFQFRCIPRNDDVQRIIRLNEQAEADQCMVKKRMDREKNTFVLGYIARPHQKFQFRTTGTVKMDLLSRKAEPTDMLYRVSSTYTEVGTVLGQWYEEMAVPSGTVRERAAEIAHFVHEKMTPLEGNGELFTAENAAREGTGDSCDYAQIMIALCHMDGIASRFVMGFITGEEKLHAWVEVQAEDGIFYGYAPFFDCPVTECYVALSHGRDGKECCLDMGADEKKVTKHVEVYVKSEISGKKEYSLMPEDSNTRWLAKRLAFRNSSYQSIPLERLNSIMTNLEFTILTMMQEMLASEENDGKLYVRDVAARLNIPAVRLSPVFSKMEDEGFLHWDSDAEQGASFVVFTDYGRRKLEEQKNIVLSFYEHVINRFGREKAGEMDKLMLELESLLRDELELYSSQKKKEDNRRE